VWTLHSVTNRTDEQRQSRNGEDNVTLQADKMPANTQIIKELAASHRQ
jgi:hypothetical protein